MFLKVSDSALRCFASVAERFTRRGVDPAPLAKHGLIEELLERLGKAGTLASDRTPGNGATPDGKSANPSVATVISLLSTLCRGSPVITEVELHLFCGCTLFQYQCINDSSLEVSENLHLSNYPSTTKSHTM